MKYGGIIPFIALCTVAVVPLKLASIHPNQAYAKELPYVGESSGQEAPNPCGLETVRCGGEQGDSEGTDGRDYLSSLSEGNQGVLHEVTAYTSEVGQTDDSPEVGAMGTNIYHLYLKGQNICASNDYPLGTTIHIEGIGKCLIADRMNRRYTGTGRIDLYMGKATKEALKFGIKHLQVTE